MSKPIPYGGVYTAHTSYHFPLQGAVSLDYPSRKLQRLKHYDYSANGAYFVTICAYQHRSVFSQIYPINQQGMFCNRLTELGDIAETTLLQMQQRFPGITIDKYVIMPNHIHAIIYIDQEASSKKVALPDVLCAFKSLTTRACKRVSSIESVFQKSFHDHVIRNDADYQRIWGYIDTNPSRWKDDCYYCED